FRVSLPFRTVAQTVSLQLLPFFLSMKELVRAVTRVRFGDRAFAAGTRKPLSSSRASHIGDLGEESALSRPRQSANIQLSFRPCCWSVEHLGACPNDRRGVVLTHERRLLGRLIHFFGLLRPVFLAIRSSRAERFLFYSCSNSMATLL